MTVDLDQRRKTPFTQFVIIGQHGGEDCDFSRINLMHRSRHNGLGERQKRHQQGHGEGG